jgi:hypothetical protein
VCAFPSSPRLSQKERQVASIEARLQRLGNFLMLFPLSAISGEAAGVSRDFRNRQSPAVPAVSKHFRY